MRVGVVNSMAQPYGYIYLITNTVYGNSFKELRDSGLRVTCL